MADAEVPEDPAALVRARYALYVETLRARMPPAQFGLLMEVIREYVKAGAAGSSSIWNRRRRSCSPRRSSTNCSTSSA